MLMKTELSCPECGASAGCEHARYLSPGQLAAAALARDPDKSDRAIAAEVGIGLGTVQRARKSTDPNGSVRKRTGRDGKVRRPPKPKPKSKSKAKVRPASLPVVWTFALRQHELREANDVIRLLHALVLPLIRHRDDWRPVIRTDEDREEVAHAMHQIANDLSVLAQQVAGVADEDD